jgi:ubiquinone/menaquinone biosynthesis C-methylase UbiE
MLSSIKSYLANQARKPSGWFGRIVAPRVFNRENSDMEDFGLELMDPDVDDHILEIGFGNGRLISEIIPKLTGGKVCGIDISDEMVELAYEKNAKWAKNGVLEIRKASIADIPYPDDYFDKLFTCNTIYFWPNPKVNIKEVQRVLKPKGQFLCAFRDKPLMKSKSSAVTDNRDVFQNLYHPGEVKQLLRNAGFQQVELRTESSGNEDFHVAVARN